MLAKLTVGVCAPCAAGKYRDVSGAPTPISGGNDDSATSDPSHTGTKRYASTLAGASM